MHCTYSEEVFWLKPEAQDHLRINAGGSESQSSDFHPSSVFWWDSRWPLPFVLGNKDWWNMIYFHFTEEQRIGKDVADNIDFYRSCCGTREWSVSFSVYDSFSDVPERRVWFASKNLTPCRMHWNAVLIAQIIAKCHSFPNMYDMLWAMGYGKTYFVQKNT